MPEVQVCVCVCVCFRLAGSSSLHGAGGGGHGGKQQLLHSACPYAHIKELRAGPLKRAQLPNKTTQTFKDLRRMLLWALTAGRSCFRSTRKPTVSYRGWKNIVLLFKIKRISSHGILWSYESHHFTPSGASMTYLRHKGVRSWSKDVFSFHIWDTSLGMDLFLEPEMTPKGLLHPLSMAQANQYIRLKYSYEMLSWNGLRALGRILGRATCGDQRLSTVF